jgi:lipid-A-disaccharide synthase
MTDRPLTIFISAAEASGDEHASRLIAAMRRLRPDARFIGVAGEKMAAAGCEVVADLTKRASMAGGAITQFGYYYRKVRQIRRRIAEIRPDLHIPVDSPALNWHLAAEAKRCGAKVFYYIAPQVWAWAPWRVKKLARLADQVGCILPFEQPYLRHRGVNATYVGHPLLDTLPPRPRNLPDLAEAWANGQWRVALLPGSRPGEIRGHAPALAAAAGVIRKRWPAARCTVTARTEGCAEMLRPLLADADVELAVGRTREVLADSHFALATSGTVTLEVAYFGVPMAIFYRVGRLSYNLLGRWLLRTPHLSLVNILAGRRLVPELMPWHGRIGEVADTVLEVMEDYGWLCQTRRDLLALTDNLRAARAGSASENAAALALETAGR